eukprot:361440-Chlamydomonas_euryale.AAC.2
METVFNTSECRFKSPKDVNMPMLNIGTLNQEPNRYADVFYPSTPVHTQRPKVQSTRPPAKPGWIDQIPGAKKTGRAIREIYQEGLTSIRYPVNEVVYPHRIHQRPSGSSTPNNRPDNRPSLSGYTRDSNLILHPGSEEASVSVNPALPTPPPHHAGVASPAWRHGLRDPCDVFAHLMSTITSRKQTYSATTKCFHDGQQSDARPLSLVAGALPT